MDGSIKLRVATLKSLRRRAGLSQESLASACATQGCPISLATIKRAESGKSILYRTAKTIAQYYAVPLSQLYTNEPAAILDDATTNRVVSSTVSSADPASTPGFDNHIIGRDYELSQLHHTYQTLTRQGRGCVFYLRGTAGIGKSRLIQEFRNIADQLDLHNLQSTVTQTGPWHESLLPLLRFLLGLQVQEKVALETIRARALQMGLHGEEIHYLLNLFDVSTSQDQANRTSYYTQNEAETRIVLQLIRQHQRPLLIAIEDIHAASAKLLLSLKSIAAQIAELPVILVLSSRLENDPIDAIWRSSVLNTPFITYDLCPLNATNSHEFAQRFANIDQHYRQQCIRLAAGNPLFLEQLLYNFPINLGQFPTNLSSLIHEKLARLEADDRQAVLVAALIGDTFSTAPICFVLGWDRYDPRALIDHYLVMLIDDTCCQFCHALIRQGICESIAADVQAQLHERLALWYQSIDSAAYARHLCSARHNRAPTAFIEAAEAFIVKYNYADALSLVDHALSQSAPQEQRFYLLLLKGVLLKHLELPEKTVQYFQQAIEIARTDEQFIKIYLEWIAVYLLLHRYADAQRLYLDAMRHTDANTCESILSKLAYYEDVLKSQPNKLACADSIDQSILDLLQNCDPQISPKQTGGVNYQPRVPPGTHSKPHRKPTITIGVLHSQTGFMQELERGVIQTTLLAVSEINNNGGILDHHLTVELADGQSDDAIFAAQAHRLIEQSKVVSIFGCSTSSSRRLVKPIVEARQNLLVYPFQYEGIEQSNSIAYVGPAPNQQAIPAVQWLYNRGHRRFFLVGSDYIYPHVTNRLIREKLAQWRAEVTDEHYIRLAGGCFDAVAERIAAEQPDSVISTLVGFDNNYRFFKALHQAGVATKQTTLLSLVLSENDLAAIPLKYVEGVYTTYSYFQNIDDPINEEFVRKFKHVFGSAQRIGGYMESAYTGVQLWAKAAQKAGCFAPDAIMQAMRGLSHYAPGGMVYFDEENNHVWRHIRIAQVGLDGEFHVLWNSDNLVKPEPYPSQTGDWDAYLEQVRAQWQGQWENKS